MPVSRLLGFAAIVLLVPVCGYAQDGGRIGVVTGYPAGVGVLWHASKQVAIRPDFVFTTSSAESPVIVNGVQNAVTKSSTKSYSIGISALVYVRDEGDLRLYVAPRAAFGWLRNTTKLTTTSSSVSESESNPFAVSGGFGAQYSLHRRFAAFGEAGINYSRATAKYAGLSDLESKTHSWSIRSAIGVIIYF